MNSTASKNVHIINDALYLPHLQKTRRICAYLPEDYQDSNERYPVIYMHDGQNLFDRANSFGAEWEIDETLDAQHGKTIVIGIDNGEAHRMAEYLFHDNEEHGAAEGRKYLADLTQVIKPFVDELLRTKPEREFTSVAGSSMGGLISFYAGLYFPRVFGAVGIFSPALWLDAPMVFEEAQNVAKATTLPQRWYFYAGAMESETMVEEVATMVHLLKAIPNYEITYQIAESGIHDEQVWSSYFPFYYNWLTGNIPGKAIEGTSDLLIPASQDL